MIGTISMMQIQVQIEHSFEFFPQTQNSQNTIIDIAISRCSLSFSMVPTTAPIYRILVFHGSEQRSRCQRRAANVRAHLKQVVHDRTIVIESVLTFVQIFRIFATVTSLQIVQVGGRVKGLEKLGITWLCQNNSFLFCYM